MRPNRQLRASLARTSSTAQVRHRGGALRIGELDLVAAPTSTVTHSASRCVARRRPAAIPSRRDIGCRARLFGVFRGVVGTAGAVFDEEFEAEFDAKGLTYEHRLIDDMVASCLKWTRAPWRAGQHT